MASTNGESAVLGEILETLKKMQVDHSNLAAAVDAIGSRVDLNASLNNFRIPSVGSATASPNIGPTHPQHHNVNGRPSTPPHIPAPKDVTGSPSIPAQGSGQGPARRSSVTSRIILTTYPGQSGIDPLPMDWGNKDPMKRGPVVVSRHTHTIRRRNGTCIVVHHNR